MSETDGKLTRDEELSLLRSLVNGEPNAERNGEWAVGGRPIMGWQPRVGARWVREPETGVAIFSSEKRALEAAKAFQRRCLVRLNELKASAP